MRSKAETITIAIATPPTAAAIAELLTEEADDGLRRLAVQLLVEEVLVEPWDLEDPPVVVEAQALHLAVDRFTAERGGHTF